MVYGPCFMVHLVVEVFVSLRAVAFPCFPTAWFLASVVGNCGLLRGLERRECFHDLPLGMDLGAQR